VVLIEDHAHGNASLDCGRERRADHAAGRGRQAQVVDRNLQRLLRAVDEGRDSLRDREVGLRAVGQEEEVER
jgi:hypothetical protein